MSDFEKSLYVDADTLFEQSPQAGFDLLDKWDIALAETQTRSLSEGIAGKYECDATANEFFGADLMLYHNSGMLFWRKNEATSALFELWRTEWLRFEGWDEQVALLRALLKSNALFLTLPYTWNHSDRRDSYLVTHWFGAGDARIVLKMKSRFGQQPIEKKPDKVMTWVELSQGRFKKCRIGDEDKVRKLTEQQNERKQKMDGDRGALIKVEKRPGQYVKMYRKDAEALGLIKAQKPAENKMILPAEYKSVVEAPKPVVPVVEEISKDQWVDFTEIKGIGKSADELLHVNGIHTFEDLLDADCSFLPAKAKSAIETWLEILK